MLPNDVLCRCLKFLPVRSLARAAITRSNFRASAELAGLQFARDAWHERMATADRLG